jgi:hypothetical protein
MRTRAILTAGVLALLAIPAGARADATDEASTRTYLEAASVYDQALNAALPGVLESVRTEAATIETKCPGVLAEAAAANSTLSAPPRRIGSEREIGEKERRQRQLDALEDELDGELLAPLGQATAASARAFQASVSTLHWSSASVAHEVRAFIGVVAPEPEPPATDVCADMSAWVQSGYTSLAAVSRHFLLGAGEIELTSFSNAFVPPALARYEDAADRGLAHQLATLERQFLGREHSLRTVLSSTEEKLGLRSQSEVVPPLETLHKGTLLGRGLTASGKRFTVTARRVSSLPSCKFVISIAIAGSGSGSCGPVSGHRPEVECQQGELTIEERTPAATRRMRLRLSDGRTLESEVIRIPARFGGPSGVYYQAVRGPRPVPVELSELDAHGKLLARRKLQRIADCTKHPLKYLPGGTVTVVRSSVGQDGPAYSIVARRYRLYGHIHLSLQLDVSNEREPPFPGLLEASGGGADFPGAPFQAQTSQGCEPKPYEIVYGLLGDPADTVSLNSGGTLVPLTKVTLPAQLHTHAVLAYAAVSPPAQELLVRTPAGKTFEHQSLDGQGTVERCEGEAEPPLSS